MIPDGASLMIGGFMAVGTPQRVIDELVRQNKMRGGEKLTNDGGRRLRIQSGKVSVTDGPYSEAAEVLGGYFAIEAADYDEAVALAHTCPHLTGDQWIEVRQIDAVR